MLIYIKYSAESWQIDCALEFDISSNYNRANEYVCGNWLLYRLMAPSQRSQVVFASAFSWIGDFFVFLAFIVYTLWPLCWIYEYACNEHAGDSGCGGGLDFAYHLTGASRRPLLMTTSTQVWTLNPGLINKINMHTCSWSFVWYYINLHIFPYSGGFEATKADGEGEYVWPQGGRTGLHARWNGRRGLAGEETERGTFQSRPQLHEGPWP